MRLAVDATALLIPRTGVGMFTAELLKELGRRPDFVVSAFVIGHVGQHWLPSDIGGGVREMPGRLPSGLVRRLWKFFAAPVLNGSQGKMIWSTAPTTLCRPRGRAASVVSVHDVGFEHDPPMSIPGALGHRQSVRAASSEGPGFKLARSLSPMRSARSTTWPRSRRYNSLRGPAGTARASSFAGSTIRAGPGIR